MMTAGNMLRSGAVVFMGCAMSFAPGSSSLAQHSTPHGTLMDESLSAAPADHSYVPPDPSTLGGPFELIDHTGRTVTDRTFRGQWMLIFFGFTACREICPVALVTMSEAINRMGEDGDRIQPIFIDFSLEEPDLAGLAQFVGNFHPRLLGLTGDRKQTFAAVREFKVRREYMMSSYSKKETGPRIDHTTYLYLVDPTGVTRGYFSHDLSADDYVREIRYHLEGGRGQR